MSLFNTLETSRSAIDHFSDKLSLIGVNIASTQTAGYDKQRQLASDNFYQQLSAAGVAGGTHLAGGVHGRATESIFTVGELAHSDQSTDLAINGRGFLPVTDPKTGEFFLTRVGNFDLDTNGFLRLPTGEQLMGIQGPPPAFQVSLDAQGKLVFTVAPSSAGATPGDSGQVLQMDMDGVSWNDGSLAFASTAPAGGSTFTVFGDGSIATSESLNKALAGLNGGTGLELGRSYTAFGELERDIAGGGLSEAQANASMMAATGEAGLTVGAHTYSNVRDLRAALDAGTVTMAAIDTAITAASSTGLDPAWNKEADIRNGLAAGLFTESDINTALGTTPLVVGDRTFNGSTDNAWSDLKSIVPVNPRTGQIYTLAEIEEAAPRALGVDIATDGTVNWKFANGTSAPAGWLRLADVRDPGGLQAVGESLFTTTASSVLIGDWQTNIPGEGGRGELIGGALEMSNVDITTEFGDLLASQRSYQASSKMLSVMDDLLSTVIALRR